MSPERDRRSMEQEHHPRPPILNPSSGTSTSPLNNYVFPRQELANHSQSAPTNKLNLPSPTSSRAVPPDRFHSTHRAEWIGSPKAELVDARECERRGVEGLSLDEPKLERPGGVHGSRSQATSGTVGGGMSGSWPNPNDGTVDDRCKPAPFVLGGMFRNGGVLGVGLSPLSYCTLPVDSSQLLLLLTTVRLADDEAQHCQ
jgi:hypothetical protein